MQSGKFVDKPISKHQQVFSGRLQRSIHSIPTSSVTRAVPESLLVDATRQLRSSENKPGAMEFDCFVYALSRVAKNHPRFRTQLLSESTQREYEHLTIGCAVGTMQGELTTAMVSEADALSFSQVSSLLQESVALALTGKDQADATIQMLVSFLYNSTIISVQPIVVSPACSVVFLGSAYAMGGEKMCNCTIAFDHRIIHGLNAMAFCDDVVAFLEKVSSSGPMHEPPDTMQKEIAARPFAGAAETGSSGEVASICRSLVAALTRTPVGSVRDHEPLRRFGLDSLKSVEFARRLATETGKEVPVTLVWNYPTIQEIEKFIDSAGSLTKEEKPGSESGLRSFVGALSDEEAKALLDKLGNT